jgi:hypothetical protein
MYGIRRRSAQTDAILGFVQATPFTSGSKATDAIFMLIFISPVLLLPNYESIAKISALGTGLIAIIFLFIGSYGLHQNGMEGFYSISWEEAWPENFAAFSNWFGVAVCKFHNFWKRTCILYYEHTTHPS